MAIHKRKSMGKDKEKNEKEEYGDPGIDQSELTDLKKEVKELKKEMEEVKSNGKPSYE